MSLTFGVDNGRRNIYVYVPTYLLNPRSSLLRWSLRVDVRGGKGTSLEAGIMRAVHPVPILSLEIKKNGWGWHDHLNSEIRQNRGF